MTKENIIIKKCSSTYFDKKHRTKLPCKNSSGYCYWQWAISGAGKIHHCFCNMGVIINKRKPVKAMIV